MEMSVWPGTWVHFARTENTQPKVAQYTLEEVRMYYPGTNIAGNS